jgi:hypothetical protein
MCTTSTAAVEILSTKVETIRTLLGSATRDPILLRSNIITACLLVGMLGCTVIILAGAGWKIAMSGKQPADSKRLAVGL